MSWQPMLEGSLRDRAWESVKAILADLDIAFAFVLDARRRVPQGGVRQLLHVHVLVRDLRQVVAQDVLAAVVVGKESRYVTPPVSERFFSIPFLKLYLLHKE